MSEFDWREHRSAPISGPALESMLVRMEALKRQMYADLNRDLFKDTGPSVPLPPLTWRQRLQRRAARVRSYGATLWAALKGDDPYDDYDY